MNNWQVEQFLFGKWTQTVSYHDSEYVIDRANELRQKRVDKPYKYSAVRLINAQNEIEWTEA